MRKAQRAMNVSEAYRILRTSLWVTLSTVNARKESPLGLGSPYAVPISVADLDGVLYFHCALQGHKVDNLHEDSRVCITAVAEVAPYEKALSMAYESATFFAHAEEVLEREEKMRALHCLCSKFAPSQDPTDQIEASVDKTGVWKVHVLGCSAKQRKFE